ncbi:MAG TPA: hypothetical protein VGL22_04600 [Terracidiphilus sp.]|jgi:hypothetical protein
MRLLRARAVLLLPMLLSGCVHKTKMTQNQPVLAPPIEDTPPGRPDKAPINLPPAVVTVPSPPQPTVTNTPPPPPQKPKASHRKPKATPPADQDTDVAANTPAPAAPVSAAGSFSTVEASNDRKQTDNTIEETEKGLNGITRNLNDQEKKTSAQIREFLKQAKAALTTGDVDGAHSLALRAKVLLGELTQ